MIRIGTSGWSYDDWKGTWYPPDLPRGRMLDYYASVFDIVELNATYYRIPGLQSAQGMVKQAEGRLRFAIKAPGELTHEKRLEETTLAAWFRFLEPLREAGCLSSILVQFPQRFHLTPENAHHVQALGSIMSGLPLVAEFRHASWDAPETAALLRDQNMSRAIVDQPLLRGLSEPGAKYQTGPIVYLRFHGRNAAAWHSHENSADRYRYVYSEAELKEWVPILRDLDAEATSTEVFFNNHPEGLAPQNAETLAMLLQQPLRGSGYKDLFS